MAADLDRDDMAVLLQEAVTELQATRKQTETLLEKQKLIDENSNLTVLSPATWMPECY